MKDTIAAIATSLSESGIGIIRISGPEAVSIGDALFRSPSGKQIVSKMESHTIRYGFIVDNLHHKEDICDSICGESWKDSIIDEVMLSLMKGPSSYTAEDVVEINCHGGVLIMQKILDRVIRAGARMAQPGEFTKRAFLNGRIDLTKAEAVMDMISARSEDALKASLNQLKGYLAMSVKAIREEILYELAFIESALDDPEHISLDGYEERLTSKNRTMINQLRTLLDTADNGRIIKEGIKTVILGKPNTGKSSLMNLLLKEERAIVTDIAGTTRDVIEEDIQLGGIGLRIIDTAGIRDTEDIVERLGVEKTKQYAKEADLILYMIDGSVALSQEDMDIFPLLNGKNTIVLLNKTDLISVVGEETIRNKIPGDYNILSISARENRGMDLLEKAIRQMFFEGKNFQGLSSSQETVITNLRHKEALQEALESLKMVEKSMEDGMPEDFYSIDLMNAYSCLGRIIGEEVEDDLVEEIFSKFCMGK